MTHYYVLPRKSEPGYWTYEGVHLNDRIYKIIDDFEYKSFNRKTLRDINSMALISRNKFFY